jgi:hypothetical protein
MRPVHSQGKRAKGPPLELSPAEGAGATITGGAEKGLRLFSFQIVGCCCCCWQKGAERGDVAMGSRSHVLNYVCKFITWFTVSPENHVSTLHLFQGPKERRRQQQQEQERHLFWDVYILVRTDIVNGIRDEIL